MANADVLDILSDTLTPVNRASANKDEIIREKVLHFLTLLYHHIARFILEKRSEEKYSSTRGNEA